MKPYLKSYKLFIPLAVILQIGLYLLSMYVLLAPSPLRRFVTHSYEPDTFYSTTRFLIASSKDYEQNNRIPGAKYPRAISDTSSFLDVQRYADRIKSMTPGETVNQIAVEVFGSVLHQIQAVGIWGNSLYGYNLMTQVQDQRLILDGNSHRFEMYKIWQPYALRPIYLLLDYLTILAGLFLLQFAFIEARAQLRKRSRLCSKCARPLLKTDTDTTCPECGQFNPAEPPTPQPQ